MKKNALPPLPFGDNIAVTHECAFEFGTLIDRMFPGVEAYDPTTPFKDFRSRTATIKLSSATVVAASISPTHVERKNNPHLTFMVPMAGDPSSTATIGDRTIHWGSGRGGVFLPQAEEKIVGEGDFRSHLMWNLSREQLQQTAQAMLGEDHVNLRLDEARLLPQAIAGVKVDVSFSALFPVLSLYAKQPEVLQQIGIEDVIYRQTVMLLRPDLFEEQTPGRRSTEPTPSKNKVVIDKLCQYIRSHLSDELSLTQLEIVSGLSARSLQMSFAQLMGCTPMSWIKEQRLLKVRSDLLTRDTESSIEAIALAGGFQSMPAFFVAYKKRFGETPGQTRKAAL